MEQNTVEKLKGEFVKRKPTAKKIWQVGNYNRSVGKWELEDVEDISHSIHVKKGTILFVAEY